MTTLKDIRFGIEIETVFAGRTMGTIVFGGDGTLTDIVSGRFAFDASAGEPLMSLLPPEAKVIEGTRLVTRKGATVETGRPVKLLVKVPIVRAAPEVKLAVLLPAASCARVALMVSALPDVKFTLPPALTVAIGPNLLLPLVAVIESVAVRVTLPATLTWLAPTPVTAPLAVATPRLIDGPAIVTSSVAPPMARPLPCGIVRPISPPPRTVPVGLTATEVAVTPVPFVSVTVGAAV